MTQSTTTTDELDLGLDQVTVDEGANVLAEAEAAVAADIAPDDEEVYDVVDLYPDVELPEEVAYSLEMDEALGLIQAKIDHLQAELVTAQNKLRNTEVTLRNKAKEELLMKQIANDEALVMSEIDKPEVIRLLAKVIRVMQNGHGGELVSALTAIEEGRLPSSMAQLAAPAAPAYQPAPAVTPEIQPISTTQAPAKWKPM